MWKSRWGTLGRVLLGAAAVLGTALALALLLAGPCPGEWVAAAGGVLAGLAGGAVAAGRLHDREIADRQRRLAIGFAHHVRTPLATIQIYDEMLLLGRERSAEEREEWLHLIGREAQRLNQLTESLLLVTQPETAQAFPARRAVDLGELLEDVAADSAESAAVRGLTLSLTAAHGLTVEVDPGAMRQAVGCLVENALCCASTGEVVGLTVRAREGFAELAVEGGRRLSPRDLRRVWEPFARLDDAAEQGSGLALSVVQRIARAHGGRALVEPAARGGTRFCLLLPLRPSAAP